MSTARSCTAGWWRWQRSASGEGARLGAQLALVVDGMYVSAAHLGPAGPAATGPALAAALLAGHDE